MHILILAYGKIIYLFLFSSPIRFNREILSKQFFSGGFSLTKGKIIWKKRGLRLSEFRSNLSI